MKTTIQSRLQTVCFRLRLEAHRHIIALHNVNLTTTYKTPRFASCHVLHRQSLLRPTVLAQALVLLHITRLIARPHSSTPVLANARYMWQIIP